MKSLLVSALLAPSLGLNVLLLVGLTAPESVGPLARLVRTGATAPGVTAPAAAQPVPGSG